MPLEQDRRWIVRHMPATRAAVQRLPDLTACRIACSVHLDPKMLPFVEGLLERGAAVYLATCNPATVHDDVVAYLRERGAEGKPYRNMSAADYTAHVRAGLDWAPSHLCEMGADFSHTLLSEGVAGGSSTDGGTSVDGVLPLGGLEATGSGITRLQNLELPYPVFNWDDLPVKEGLHNRFMVGLTTWTAFFERTHLTLHEKRVTVIGYGSVGRGVCDAARAFGGTVSVVERDPGRALEATYAGWRVGSLEELAPQTDVLVTATGAARVVLAEHLEALPDGAFLLNVGHRTEEIDPAAFSGWTREDCLPHVSAWSRDGRTCYLFANGAMANLSAGQGDSVNAFDRTLAILTEAMGFLVSEGTGHAPGLHVLPSTVWQRAAH